MNLQHRWFHFALLAFTTSLAFVAATCRAQLLPPGDFRGKALHEWGREYAEWTIRTDQGGETLPDTVNGVRYLPFFQTGDFVFDVTIPPGTAVMTNPFGVHGERYDDGSEDNPADPIINEIFEGAAIRVTFNGNVVLEGPVNSFPDRKSDAIIYPQPISYASPQPRGPDLNAVAAIFDAGQITTIFDIPQLGNHTIKVEFDSDFFGMGSGTYNISVVPEPCTLILLGSATLTCTVCVRRRKCMAKG